MSFADIAREVAAQWKKLSDEEKKPWKVLRPVQQCPLHRVDESVLAC